MRVIIVGIGDIGYELTRDLTRGVVSPLSGDALMSSTTELVYPIFSGSKRQPTRLAQVTTRSSTVSPSSTRPPRRTIDLRTTAPRPMWQPDSR